MDSVLGLQCRYTDRSGELEEICFVSILTNNSLIECINL
jgi:hypothetical protein